MIKYVKETKILIQSIADIEWSDKKEHAREEDLLLVKNQIPFCLPKKFIDLLKISDGGNLEYIFNYYDVESKDIMGSVIAFIYSAKEDTNYKDDLLNAYNDPPEGFPENLVAFGDVGNGDKICFDYRMNPKTDNPPVVYWNFESQEGEDISPLANDFMGFLRMLREPEPIENYLKKD